MTTDPMTDEAAAKAFTEREGHKPWRARLQPERSSVIRFHSPHKGKPQCQGSTLETGSNFTRRHQCGNVGKVALADGSTWCGIHEPAAVAKRKAKSDAASKARQDQWSAQWKAQMRARAAPALAEALRKIADGDNDARETARLALEAYDAI